MEIQLYPLRDMSPTPVLVKGHLVKSLGVDTTHLMPTLHMLVDETAPHESYMVHLVNQSLPPGRNMDTLTHMGSFIRSMAGHYAANAKFVHIFFERYMMEP